ncbi:hypothetical protein CTI12_AA568290 [Artemisia annua]|uniref:DOG1 domain-containing protein n=1 Tax=Artemisia annua TaxID=35608 RepID=A0A2U1KSY7_ARTAN|nr:hypothetical protein CTI12_AA568290 [Artemisia annua]
MILAQIEPFPDLQIEPFTDQQIMRIYELQNIILEGEKILSKEHAKVNQSLSDAIISENLKFPYHAANYMAQMSTAMNKLSNLGDIVNQADKLRLQTIHSLYQLMTTRQASRSLMAIGEYFHRIHSLSSLWGTREQKP